MTTQASAVAQIGAPPCIHRAQPPVAWQARSQYRAQLLESRLVADRLGIADWALLFQSRSRRREDPWLESNTCQYPGAERARSRLAAVICLIGFVLRLTWKCWTTWTSGA